MSERARARERERETVHVTYMYIYIYMYLTSKVHECLHSSVMHCMKQSANDLVWVHRDDEMAGA